MKNYLSILSVDVFSVTPKYVQVMNGFIAGIERGEISKGDMLPSINCLSYDLEVSRNTIERVYYELKKMGIAASIPGKGVYITNTDFKRPLKVLLLFNKLSSHKKIIYDSLVMHLGECATIDFYVYNNDFNLFKRIITEKIDSDYSKFIIVPHFMEHADKAHEVVNLIPKDKLILVDKLMDDVTGSFAAVYENFEKDIYEALLQLLDRLSQYHTLKLVFPVTTYHPKDIIEGFSAFCNDYNFGCELIGNIENEVVVPGTVYINLMEDDLVTLIEKIMDVKMRIGVDVGLISYNETSIKKLILNGLTTISTDFGFIGKRTAYAALNNKTEHVPAPFTVNVRNSL
ncbi:GntR family transcriptional regulator [Dyadobacter sp. CY312]|uniref:GntR family transcriptional regulator n=1 Tax=Dyadobacter sp. CY312 TaxID=2907303 RepID=UPI001F3352C3|nr:GntR family transcriptional regulator [Dyadobacter sp. CY312]MCE7043777.1 GntR family transcriptional regulator [Dyadobacter sp. CY312]